MLRLIKAELFKLFKNRTFKVLCIVSICLSLITFVMTTSIMDKLLNEAMESLSEEEANQMMDVLNSSGNEEVVTPGSMGLQIKAKDPMNPTTKEIFHSSFGIGISEVLIGILVAAFLAKEYTNRTIKNILAYGKKRSQFYLAKFSALVVAIVILLAALTIIPTVGNTIINGWGESFEVSQLLGMFGTFIASVITNSAVAALVMIIAILAKSNGGTIGIVVGVFILLPTIASYIYGINNVFDKIYEVTPFYNNQLANSIYATNGDVLRAIIIAIITMVIALIAGISIFKKQDIK